MGLGEAALPYLMPIVEGLKPAFAWAGVFLWQYKNLTKLILYSIGAVVVLGGAFLALKIEGELAGAAFTVFKFALILLTGGMLGLVAGGLVV